LSTGVCPECGGTFADTDRFCQRDGAKLLPASDGDPLYGQTVGSYRVAALLGAGGMGRVYLGVHPTIGSRVAIKVLSRDCAGRPDLLDRFFAEAQVVNRIRHEGIVNVLDLAALPDGRPYIVMELLSGEPLSAMLQRIGQLEPAHAVAIVCPLLDALAAAHDQGVVHRDLKPDNVFITRHGRVVVLDFGIAKLLPERRLPDQVSPATRTGALLGTPGYMAPEQIHGRPATAATDLYAVGIILYQALTGRLPFESDSLFELMQMHVSAEPAPIAEVRPDVPPALIAAVSRAMAKDPAWRFPSARGMAAALAAALGSVAPVEPPRPRPSRRGMIAGIGLGSVTAAALVLLAMWKGDPASKPAETPTVAQTSGGPETPTAAPTGKAEEPAAPDTPKAEEPAAPDTPKAEEPAAPETPTAKAEEAAPGGPRPGKAQAPARPTPTRETPAQPAEEEPARAAAAPKSKSKSERPGVTEVGGVTIINTAEQARAMTGLEPISARPESSGGTFDPIRTLAQAESMARKLMPDAVLVGFDVDHARPDGRALLRADSGANYRFRSPARSKRPADVPRNVEVDIPCMVHVDVEGDKIVAGAVTDEECDNKRLRSPRCSIADLWQRARAEGAPKTGDWVARISYMHDGWFIDIAKAGKPPFDDFTLSVPDTCP
jgi:serine/threonine protein kinase